MLRNIGFHSHKKKLQSSGVISKKITENNSIPLEEILSEESVIDELENHNQILIKYLTKEKVKQMIDYIIKEPPSDTTFDKGHKYPWVCSQLFNIENSEILRYFYTPDKDLDIEENKMDIEYDKNKENKIELLDYLLNFLVSNDEPNYVLCGYFASLIKTLLNTKPVLILKYFYMENKNFVKELIKYSYRESIAEILNKIFQYDVGEEEFDIQEMDLIRMEILEDLFNLIDIDMDNEKLDSISTLIKNLSTEENLFTDLLNNQKIIHNLITKPLKDINLLIQNKSSEMKITNQRRNFIIIIDIIINWIQAIHSLEIDLPSTTDESEEEITTGENANNNNLSHTLLSYELFNILSNLIKINFNKNIDNINNESKILQCFDEKELIPLGLFRIKIVELLGNLFSYFKHIPNLYDKLLIESKFFENALDYLFEYEFNNIYQESLLFLFKKYLNYSEYHPILSEFLFTKINIMDIIISKIKSTEIKNDSNNKKDCFIYSSGNTTSRGYISFLISLAYKINTIIGGDALRINDTLSREGSISFMNRAQPFVAKEEITKFYGMEENELYEQVSNVSEDGKKSSKLNCAVKSMEKYLNDNWNEFFYEYVSEKIKLYETKLFKDADRDSLFRNPFILENDDEKIENKENNFGLGDDEDQDILKERTKKQDFNDILYGDYDIDFNSGNRFKMSMRLPRNMNNNNNTLKVERRRSSCGAKPMQSKVLVDEIDDIDNNANEEKDNQDNIEEKEEDENPLDKFKKGNDEINDNNELNDDEDPFANFKKKDDNRKISLVSFRKKKKDEDNENKEDNNDINGDIKNQDENEENPLDKFKRENNDDINDNNNGEENEENPLDKFNKENKADNLKNTEEKMDIDNDDLYADNEEDEDVLKKVNNDNKDNKEDNNMEKNNQKEENNLEDDLYEEEEENNEKEEEINPLDKFKQENPKKEENNHKNKDLEENPFDQPKKEENTSKKKETEEEEDEEEEEEEDDEEENPIDKFNREKVRQKEEKDENPLDKFKTENKDKEEKEKNLEDMLYETKEDDDEEEEEEEDSDDNKNIGNKK